MLSYYDLLRNACVLVLFSLRETRLNNITYQKSPWSPLHRLVQLIFTWVLPSVNYAMLSLDFSSRPSSPELPAPVFSSASTPCSILPVKRPRTTWVWNHMPDPDPQTQYFNKNTGKQEWRCRYCTRRYATTGGTRAIMEHLKTHNIEENSTRETRAINQQASIQNAMDMARENPQKRRRLNESQGESMDPDQLEILYVRWVSACSVSFRMVECPEFRALLFYINKDIDTWLPGSHNTVRDWVVRQYEAQKAKIKASLKRSTTRIHISCDLWSSPNSLAILGIVAHFITGDGELRHVVLALREIDGAHTGENLSPVILDVIVDYGFESNLGFFMMDNASNNDTMMNHLSTRTCIIIIWVQS